MADVITANLALTEPEVGASTDTWGNKLNANCDILDALFVNTTTTPLGTMATQQSGSVSIGGGSISNASISGGSIYGASINGTISGSVIQNSQIQNGSITGANIDNSPIGQSTPAAGRFTWVQFADGSAMSTAPPGANPNPPFGTVVYSSAATMPTGYQYLVTYCDATNGGFTVTLPAAPNSNAFQVVVQKYDGTANPVTVQPAGGDILEGPGTTNVLSKTNAAIYLICDGPRRRWNIAGSPGAAAAGGTTKTYQQIFTASGTFSPSTGLIAAGGCVEAFVVGGGGGGAGGSGGGGGGGGAVLRQWTTVSGAVSVTVGGGGPAGANNVNGNPGAPSTFQGISAGGGQGGFSATNGNWPGYGGASGTPNPSGGGASTTQAVGSGGGGAGGAGGPVITANGVNGTEDMGGGGGPGINGYGGGGGGAGAYGGGMGSCGAGNGSSALGGGTAASSAVANSGGGGGGGGGNGGSGIVILVWNE